LKNPQCLNRYSYCLNNPLKYLDPSGHSCWGWICQHATQIVTVVAVVVTVVAVVATAGALAPLAAAALADTCLGEAAIAASGAIGTVVAAISGGGGEELSNVVTEFSEGGGEELSNVVTEFSEGGGATFDNAVGSEASSYSTEMNPSVYDNSYDNGPLTHYCTEANKPSILENGLNGPAWTTPDGGLSYTEAKQQLALPGTPNAGVSIDVNMMQRMGYRIPDPGVVDPKQWPGQVRLPGGNLEVRFPDGVPWWALFEQ
jgi:hypothetical protein